MDACKKCSMKCLLTHGKRDGLDPVVRSFMKVMIHDRFSDVLFIPPRFAPEIASLAGTNLRVEDTSGKHWSVALSYVDGNLAFGQGWNAFISDHGIKLGDLLIVHYILGSNFVVQIYGRSGCEKLPLPSSPHSTQNKRAKTSRSSEDNNGSTTSSDAGVKMNTVQGNEKGSSEAHLKDSNQKNGVKRQLFEDPCCSINRAIPSPPKVDTRCFFDLSEFEMCKTKPVCGNGSLPNTDNTEAAMEIGETSRKISPEICTSMPDVSATAHKTKHASVSAGPSQGAQINDVAKERKEVNHMGVGSSVKIAKRENTESIPVELFDGSVKIAKKIHTKLNPEGFGGNAESVKERNPKSSGRSAKIVKKELEDFNPKSSGNEISQNNLAICSKQVHHLKTSHIGGSARIIKNEFMENNNLQNFGNKRNTNGDLQENRASVSGPPLKKVKAEIPDGAELPSPPAVTCLVASDNSFLEMPRDFFLPRHRKRMELEKEEVLLLQDSAGKLWPVFYHKKMGMKAIVGGWKHFREANRIRTGDECSFVLKDESENIYQVNVIHK